MSQVIVSIPSPISIADGNAHQLLSAPSLPAGNYKFAFAGIEDQSQGDTSNGSLLVGLGDNFVGNPTGGPATATLDPASCSAAQGGSVSSDGSNQDGSSSSGLPGIVQTAPTSTPSIQPFWQTGVVKHLGGDFTVWLMPNAFTGTDTQVIQSASLVLTPV